ncbi:hypothetical protein C5613_34905 [Rhodococcus opacus]|uniref:Uncharacterized protein n=1 Tax=Rhodococcus opacus TaxID=37919 RepID=A0A2S8IR98_RHOOP|nr:hypothetical protein C5613_34905 [Rhodococcus opacus]
MAVSRTMGSVSLGKWGLNSRFGLTVSVMIGDEARVVRDFAGWLSSQGWTVRTDEDFVDIVAEKDDHRLYVEVKAATAAPGLDVDTAIGHAVWPRVVR